MRTASTADRRQHDLLGTSEQIQDELIDLCVREQWQLNLVEGTSG